ncbi:hypothetical protein [Bacillus xiapuensis]|uniref:Right handed beta helix domain-containing protein n=1 Tax=Bacillus xiapuensis TaxID=2014075 RepID=A0ABU6N7M8_9BACI|nr:hypothetical protein [Bacillus xiapuensis]
MNGDIKKLQSDTGYLFPVTTGEAVYFNKNTTINQKISEIESLVKNKRSLESLTDVDFSTVKDDSVIAYINGKWSTNKNTGSLTIDLKRWGIKQGIPSKPYRNSDYYLANGNIRGINKALDYAEKEGYAEVILPLGEYAICYSESIRLRSNITLNLNGAKIKVIYDSDNKSPYDPRTTTDYYLFGGDVFRFTSVFNAHLINGNIIGDRYDRSFLNSMEKWNENSYGVTIENGSCFCSVKHCKIGGFMGDNIRMTGYGLSSAGVNSPKLGDLDSSGKDIASSNSLVTGLTNIPQNNERINTITIVNLGYTYTTGLNTKEVDFYFYKDDGTFISRSLNRKIFTTISIPIGATKFRVKFYNETDPTKDLWLVFQFGYTVMYNTIEFNELYHGHRGGLQPGGSYNEIKNNIFRDNGGVPDGKPAFPDSTRYHINQEDSYGDGTIIKNNLFFGGYHGVLIRNYYTKAEENVFYNTSTGILNYSTQNFIARGNYFYRVANGIGQTGTSFKEANMIIIGNSFHFSALNLYYPEYKCVATDNFFNNSTATLSDETIFKNNILYETSVVNGKTIESNLFYTNQTGDNRMMITFTCKQLINNTFKQIRVKANGYKHPIDSSYEIIFKDCYFIDSYIENNAIGAIPYRNVKYTNCIFEDSVVANIFGSNPTNSKANTIIRGGSFDIRTVNPIMNTTNGVNNNVSFDIKDVDFRVYYELNKLITYSYMVNNSTTFNMNNCNFEYYGTNPILITYGANDTAFANAYVFNNTFKNVVLEEKVNFNYFNPDTHSKVEPINGYFTLGKLINNANPTSGSNLGWICTKQGWANNTAWAANTAYVNGQQVNSNGNVYQCTVAGTTGTVAPTHTTGTAANGTVTWAYLGKKAVFNTYGSIS